MYFKNEKHKAIYLSLKQKMEKEQAVLNKLVSEVGRALIVVYDRRAERVDKCYKREVGGI